jgi:hypothetical protein
MTHGAERALVLLAELERARAAFERAERHARTHLVEHGVLEQTYLDPASALRRLAGAAVPSPSLLERLLEAERRLWQAEAYGDQRVELAELAVEVLPTGILSRRVAIEASTAGPLWERFELHEPAAFELADGVATLVYRASATRFDGSAYAAYVGSTYIRRGADWKLAVHQQTRI